VIEPLVGLHQAEATALYRATGYEHDAAMGRNL